MANNIRKEYQGATLARGVVTTLVTAKVWFEVAPSRGDSYTVTVHADDARFLPVGFKDRAGANLKALER